jgi:iron complex outermembrane receptor protein
MTANPLAIAIASIVCVHSIPASAAESEIHLKTVKVQAKTDGGADQGYRSENVSAVGPWQGRKLQDTPYAINVYSAELIENLQATTPDQVFRINPTTQMVRAQHENNQPRIMIRGFLVQKSYRDGVPDDQYNHSATMEDAESIEILNGLSGFLYGANNVGGVVNYVSKRSTEERLNQIAVSSLGNESWNVHGDFGGKFDNAGRFGYRVNLVEQGGDTAIKGQEIEKTFYSAALDGYLLENLWLQVHGMQYNYDVNGSQTYWYFGSGVKRPSASKIDNDKSWGQPWTNRWYDYNRYGANLKWDISENIGVRASYIDNRGERGSESASNTLTAAGTYNQAITGVYAPGVDTLLSDQTDKGAALFADFAFNTGSIQHKLTTGYQLSKSRQYRMNGAQPPAINLTGLPLNSPTYISRPTNIAPISRGTKNLSSHTEYRNLIIGDDVTFNDQWSAVLGAAYTTAIDHMGLGYDKSELTPSVSVLFKPVENITTYVSYIEALEAGVRAPDTQNGRDVINRGQVFEPLISEQIEIGMKTTVGGMALNTALFQIKKGLQYYVPVGTELRFEQDGKQVHKGIEFTATGAITENISLLSGFTWLDAEVKDQNADPRLEGKAPADVAEKIAKIRGEYTVPQLRNLSFSAAAIYNGSSYGDLLNTDKVPGYTLFDVGARYALDVAGTATTLRLDVQNLANKHYWNGFNGTRIGDPRTVLLSATVQF